MFSTKIWNKKEPDLYGKDLNLQRDSWRDWDCWRHSDLLRAMAGRGCGRGQLNMVPAIFSEERKSCRLTETEEEEVGKKLMAVGLLPEKHLHHAHDLIQNSNGTTGNFGVTHKPYFGIWSLGPLLLNYLAGNPAETAYWWSSTTILATLDFLRFLQLTGVTTDHTAQDNSLILVFWRGNIIRRPRI